MQTLKAFNQKREGKPTIRIDIIEQEFHQIIPEWRKLIDSSFLSQPMQEKYLQLLEKRCKQLNFFED